MPNYEFRCRKCGHEFEMNRKVDAANPRCIRILELHEIEDPTLTQRLNCAGETEKLISKSTFHLKGGGWSKDGY